LLIIVSWKRNKVSENFINLKFTKTEKSELRIKFGIPSYWYTSGD
jgi:hypothetical protein